MATSIKEIKKHNSEQFLKDIKSVREVMVYVGTTGAHFEIKKRDVMKEAQTKNICYYLTDKIFVVKRNVMIIH